MTPTRIKLALYFQRRTDNNSQIIKMPLKYRNRNSTEDFNQALGTIQ